MLLGVVRVYLQDPTREVMVIIDAAIALAALSHVVAIEARIGHRGRARVTAIAARNPTHSTDPVLLGSPPEEDSTTESSESDHSDYDSGRNRGSILALGGLFIDILFRETARGRLRCGGFGNFTNTTTSSGSSCRPIGLRRRFAAGTARARA